VNKFIKIAAVTAVLAAAPAVAFADSLQFDIGNVAIGYNDGYWDRGHVWHAWEKPEYRETYRASRNAEYHEWRHDRDKDMGWHERR
jgi:hypothetical protein